VKAKLIIEQMFVDQFNFFCFEINSRLEICSCVEVFQQSWREQSMNMDKVAIPRQTNLNVLDTRRTEMDDKEGKVKKPQLLNRPIQKSADDTRTELGKFRLGNLDNAASEESGSVVVKMSDQNDSSDSSESVCVSGTESAAAKSVEAKTPDRNDDVSQPVDLYCSEPNIKGRCTLSIITMSATTALGVLVVMKTAGDDSIANKAAWIGAAALGGLAISSAAGIIHFVYSNLGKLPAAATQPA
jgi:hypothetical protein